MDRGWIATVASPSNPTAQISMLQDTSQATSDDPFLTIKVGDVDAMHAAVVSAGNDIVLALRDEPWGVAGSSPAILTGG